MDSAKPKVMVNGIFTNSITTADRGLAYGHGLFETIRFDQGAPYLWEAHIQRLQAGCIRLSIPWPENGNQLLLDEARQLCSGHSAIIKILVTAGAGGRGYQPPKRPAPLRILSRFPLPDYPRHYIEQGVALFTCQQRLSEQPQLAGIKHLNRLDQVLASNERQQTACQEGIMLDQMGHVVEGTRTNLFGVAQGVLLTPLLNRCGISGIMRNHLLIQAQKKGIPIEEGDYKLAFFESLPELFVCNSVIGLWPVTSWGNRHYRIGDTTVALQQSIHGQQ